MAESSESPDATKFQIVRCIDWLENQNNLKKLPIQYKNDIQTIIESNTKRKELILSDTEDASTIPSGVGEPSLKPALVPLNKLRVENLRMQCEWQACNTFFVNYDLFQKHVITHTSDLHVMNKEDGVVYVCLWDVCGHKTPDFQQMVRHINYHAYHGHLLAIGFNGRATLKLERCQKDSSKRNYLPPLKSEHFCHWIECDFKFNSIQKLLDHVKQHIYYSEDFVCSWAGCGAKFQMRNLLTMHLRSHTGERLIACYHCGRHFSCNGKLVEHLSRQNVVPEAGYQCTMCGKWLASASMVREHSRQHVSYFACSLCDMSAPTRGALALHVRYRHLDADAARIHPCPQCPYKAVTKQDLQKHIPTHQPKGRKRKRAGSSEESDVMSEDEQPKKVKEKRRYACHVCPDKKGKIFSRGGLLTKHLMKVHGAQWPFGHSRFRYQISEDGMYRLTTTRLEDLEVSKKIVDGYSVPRGSLKNTSDFDIKVAEATKSTPKQFKISFKNGNTAKEEEGTNNVMEENIKEGQLEIEENIKEDPLAIEDNITKDPLAIEDNITKDPLAIEDNKIEIYMYDVDNSGNIISSETITSDIKYT